MSVPSRLFASRRMHALAVAFACLASASCSTSATVNPPAAQSSSAAATTSKAAPNSVAPPPPNISPLAKDWKTYGGTVYFGCPTEFTLSKTVLESIRPKILDTKTAELVMPAVPAIAAGETVTGGMCALSNTESDMKVVYILTTVKTASGTEPEVTKTTGYVFDLKSNQPLATKDLQPPTPELKLSPAKDWRLAPSIPGVAWMNAYADERGVSAPPKTVMLSNTDLSTLWDDPQPARIWQDVLAFQRSTVAGSTMGAELRSPTGEPVFQDDEIATVEGELSDGPDKLVQITRWDSHNPPVKATLFVDLTSRAPVKIGDTDRIPGTGLIATLSDGKLFIDGRGSDNPQFGYGVWNLRTQHWELLKTRDEAKAPISKLAFFGDHLYVTNSGNTYAVYALPGTDPVASTWSARPFGRVVGWTLVCQGETAPPSTGECREILLVRDADGRFPGPWF